MVIMGKRVGVVWMDCGETAWVVFGAGVVGLVAFALKRVSCFSMLLETI